jgi:xanthine/CO dehydrogenase XdhC/CoxF family maturation factor
VKHWQEMAHILDRVLRLGREGRSTALAVVTKIHGSAYRRPGARLLIDGEGGFIGGVSGGCLEEDVRDVGLGVLRSGEARVLHYDTGGDETRLWGLGLGCDGEVDILVQPIQPAATFGQVGPWARVRELLDGDAPLAIATVSEEGASGDIVLVGPAGRLTGRLEDAADDDAAAAAAAAALASGKPSLIAREGGRRIFADVLLPPPKLVVYGAGDDARPTVAFAAAAGFRVLVADHRPAYLTAERFPEAQKLYLVRPEDEAAAAIPADRDTYAVVKTHSLARDTAWVKRLLATSVPYVGVLGPRTRLEKIFAALGTAAAGRLYGPIGLDLGADGPEQVGLSIVAELLAVRAGRAPRHLRERKEAIHVG